MHSLPPRPAFAGASSAASSSREGAASRVQRRSASPSRDRNSSRSDAESSSSALRLALPSRPPADSTYARPERVAFFSYGPARELRFDSSAKRRFREPPTGVDLGHRFGAAVWREEQNEHLDSLIETLQRLPSSSTRPHPLLEARVVTWRGMMTRLCSAWHERSSDYPKGWEMNVQRVGDTLYIEEVVTAASLADKAAHANNERQRTMAYHGYAFESFCTAPLSDDKTSAQPDADGWSGDVNTNEQWCEIVRTSLGGHGVLIGGETDCVIESHGGNEAEGVELKTSMVLRNQRDEVRFEKKMLRFYMQAFLLGIPNVFVGFRDHQGKLQSTHRFRTLEMPRLVRNKPHAWHPSQGLSFGAEILSFLELHIPSQEASSSDPAIWRLSFDAPFTHVQLRQLEAHEVKTLSQDDGPARVGFLKREHYAWLRAELDKRQERSSANA